MPSPTYVSRGGIKLGAALRAFALNPTGWACADLGCNVGGFTDCLLQHAAARIYSVDTGYGTLAWKLRNDPRVVVLERTNAVHFDPATLEGFAGVDLVCVDLGWTRQVHALAAARRWLRMGAMWDVKSPPTAAGVESPATVDPAIVPTPPTISTPHIPHPTSHIPLIVSLIKPHYEADRALLHRGILDPADAQRVADRVLDEIPQHGFRVLQHIRSPILGGAGKGKAGNAEFLALLTPLPR